MAFFGLTALGAQNSFASSLEGRSNLAIFADSDWDAAFAQVVPQPNGKLLVQQADKLLFALFHGPSPTYELSRLLAHMDVDATAKSETEAAAAAAISRAELQRVIAELRVEIEREEREQQWTFRGACDTQSNEEYRNRIRRQRHLAAVGTHTSSSPLTAAQDLGWHATERGNKEKIKIFGKKSCAETMYASELVKSGLYF